MERAILIFTTGFVVACASSGALAQDEDRILWRFEAQGSLIWHRPATAPSGAIVFMDGGGTLYSVDPSGAQMWSVSTAGAGLGGPTAIGDDGTIYVSSNPLGSILNLRAYTPSGAPIWTFPDQSQELIAGPAVGPDGNIYAVNDVPGLGSFSLTPAGALRWNNPGFSDFGTQGSEVVFGPESGHTQLYFNANGLLTATRLDGNQRWQVNAGSQTKQVAVGTNGDVYCETWVTGAGIRLRAYDAKDGSVRWTFFQSPTNALSTPDVGPDGVIYIVRNLNQLHAINPNGTARWNTPANANFGPPTAGQSPYHGPSVSPTDDVILLGGVTAFGGPGIVRAFNTDSDALWTVQLHDGDRPNNRARFSADGCTAYIAASNGSKASVYAIRICAAAPPGPEVLAYGSGINPAGSLVVLAGEPKIGSGVQMGVTNTAVADPPPAFAFLVFSAAPAPGFPSGIPLAGFGLASPAALGELLVAVDGFNPFLQLGPVVYNGGANPPAAFALPLPNDPVLLGLQLYVQGAMALPTEGFRLGLTNALRLTIGN